MWWGLVSLAVLGCAAQQLKTAPTAAHVFIDGRLVGKTPTTVDFDGTTEVLVFRPGFVPEVPSDEGTVLQLSALPQPTPKQPATMPVKDRLEAWRLARTAARAARDGDCATVRTISALVHALDPSLHRRVLSRELTVANCLETASTSPEP